MEKRRFGRTDMDVSVLGFGAAEIGYQGVDQSTVKELVKDALDAGLNVIDTAECYMNSEELLGEALAGRRRSDYYLFTKVGHYGEGRAGEDWSRDGIIATVERSLKRLRLKQVDLVLLNSCSEEVLRKGEAIDALEEAREKGYTRYIGYSGDGKAALYAIDTGRFDALEVSVNIADQEAVDLVLPRAHSAGLGIIAKRPVANAAWRSGKKPDDSYQHEYWDRLQKLQYSFLSGDLANAISIALRFTLAQPVHTAIVGTTKPGRWRENQKLLQQGPLPQDLMARIRSRWNEIAPPEWVGQT